MIRRCTGEDPNLLMYFDAKNEQRIEGPPPPGVRTEDIEQRPCDCGRIFNDELCSVIYPHRRI